jgi:predicted nuclease of predicted toxin-antitoxin system
MKLLFDQNLSPKLAGFFAEIFVNSKHLQDLSLDVADDSVVWEFAKTEEFTIVTKDNDFNNLVAFWGFPPKVIWIRRGNCSTSDIKELLNSNIDKIKAFILDSANGIFTLY